VDGCAGRVAREHRVGATSRRDERTLRYVEKYLRRTAALDVPAPPSARPMAASRTLPVSPSAKGAKPEASPDHPSSGTASGRASHQPRAPQEQSLVLATPPINPPPRVSAP